MDEHGTLEVLNVGAGHLTLSAAPDDPIEVEKLRRVITDMLHRGYAIFVETDAGLKPVRKFDPKKMVYLLDDTMHTEPAQKPDGRRGYKRGPHREVPVQKAKATAVGRTAGG